MPHARTSPSQIRSSLFFSAPAPPPRDFPQSHLALTVSFLRRPASAYDVTPISSALRALNAQLFIARWGSECARRRPRGSGNRKTSVGAEVYRSHF